MSIDTSNNLFSLASDLVNYTSENIFLTGKAGTGKTTFLKHIRNTCAKQMAVIAPTGVAAINAGGTTIHSLFQLPFTPFIPGQAMESAELDINNTHSLIGRLKLNKEKRKLFQALELLVIDEISMVRCDTIDAIDIILKHFRNVPNQPFGGIQVLFIGDMHQLPPVIPDSEWSILSKFYNSPYFFSSRVIADHIPLVISFEKIYRQSDETFIQLLNAVRNNDLEEHHAKCLDSLYNPNFIIDKENQSIILTTHNANADKINTVELHNLNSPVYRFNAKIEGEFYEKYFPAEEILVLKPGAQVMFIKNDSEKFRRYYNGKMGIIKSIEQDKILVQCKDEEKPIEVTKEKWENIRYNFNNATKLIEEDVIGSFIQFPLRLAWAITIHKSQGLTFEKAVIDAGAAFSPGQVYVALSRCTKLEGLILKSRINHNSLKTDERIVEFSKNLSSVRQVESQLFYAKNTYQQNVLLTLFDFAVASSLCTDINVFISAEHKSFNDDLPLWIIKIMEKVECLHDISKKFIIQLQKLFIETILPQDNEPLQQRIMAACKYFSLHIGLLIQELLKSPAVTDNKQVAKSFNEQLYDLFTHLCQKKFMFENCSQGFNINKWHQDKKQFTLPSFRVNAYSVSSIYVSESLSHPALYQKLKILRDEICNKKGRPVYLVASSQTLTEMSNFLPRNVHELSQINGFGKIRLKEFGEKFLSIINDYCEQYGLDSLMENRKGKKEKKESRLKKDTRPDTKKESFDLYKQGKSISEIADERNLSVNTIENHLAFYIQSGAINIQDMLSKEKFNAIESVIKNYEGNSLSPIKEQLGKEISFSDIKMALAWKVYNTSASD